MLSKRQPIQNPHQDQSAIESTRLNTLNMQQYSYRYDILANSRNNLPINSYEDTIKKSLNNHPVLIVRAETGAGKSTQIVHMLAKRKSSK